MSSARRAHGCARSSARPRRPSFTRGSNARRSRPAGSSYATIRAPSARRSPKAQDEVAGHARAEPRSSRRSSRWPSAGGGRGGPGRPQRPPRGAVPPLLPRPVGGRACRPTAPVRPRRHKAIEARLHRNRELLSVLRRPPPARSSPDPQATGGSPRWRRLSPRSKLTVQAELARELADLEAQLEVAPRTASPAARPWSRSTGRRASRPKPSRASPRHRARGGALGRGGSA